VTNILSGDHSYLKLLPGADWKVIVSCIHTSLLVKPSIVATGASCTSIVSTNGTDLHWTLEATSVMVFNPASCHFSLYGPYPDPDRISAPLNDQLYTACGTILAVTSISLPIQASICVLK